MTENVPIDVDDVVTFFRFIPQSPFPVRADRSAAGTLPTRGYRYCEPVATASGFGWYLFPPIDYTVVWDGTKVNWTYSGTRDWYPLTSAQYPGFKKFFSENAPESVAPYAPPFLSFDPHLQMLQMWSGYIAQTKQDWSLLVRPVVNVSQSEYFQPFEGIIETDRWFGPLFTNIRLARPNVPIEFRTDFPFLQVQPLHRFVYSERILSGFKVLPELSHVAAEDWAHFHETVVKPNVQQPRQVSHYTVATRKRRKEGR